MSIFDQAYGNMSFHGNKIGHMLQILLVKIVLLTIQVEQIKMERFWIILSMTLEGWPLVRGTKYLFCRISHVKYDDEKSRGLFLFKCIRCHLEDPSDL